MKTGFGGYAYKMFVKKSKNFSKYNKTLLKIDTKSKHENWPII